MTELSWGTVHVNGSEVIVEMESTVSFDMSLMGLEASGETSSARAFPLAVFLLILLIPADESDRN